MTRAKVLYFSGEIPQGDPEGDQRDLFRKLHLLSNEKNHPILASFLTSVTSALREECTRLSRTQRDLIPTFESVLDLTDHVFQLRKSPLGGAIERVLVLVFQLGSFIAYHEVYPLEYNFQASNASLIARGPGLLSAAAIGLSPSVTMIPSIAEDITRVAFRFGLIVDQVCRSLEVSPDEINADGAWIYCSYGVDDKEATQAVARFNAEKAYPETSMAAVFNVDGKSVSIGGPPSTLRALFSESDFFRHTRNVPMKKVQGMWHQGTIYGTEHVQQIVPKIDQAHQLHLPLFSPVTGQPLEPTNATSLLKQIMEEMLTQIIRWDKTIDGITQLLSQQSPESTHLISIQPSHYVESLLDHWRVEIPTATHSTQDMMTAVMNLPLGTSQPRDARSSKIAVVGMACRFPGGSDDTEKFWALLAQGRDVHSHIPPDRFNIETHVDPTGKRPNTSGTSYGCFVDNPGLFDAMFFGMSPREVEQTDPMHRLALVTAYEALESSGYVHRRGIHARRVGTFYGHASDDYREVNSGQDVGTYFIPGGCRAFAPGRINYFFKFWGPSFSVDTACSSSLAAIQAACTSLWSGDVDMAITGGLNILTNSDVYAGLSNGHFLSPTGNCKTWDEGADGYCRADGVGSVVLKRLEDAEADNDNILGVVLSAATDHSAEAVSITHPHDVAQAHLYNQVVRRAGISPLAVGYVEMHGTGTQAGDGTEMRSVTSVFAPSADQGHVRPRDKPLHIGTVKSNVGHGEAAAGIMAFVKTMLVLQKGIIPPHVGVKTRLNPALPRDLDKRNVLIPFTAASWAPDKNRTRLAMVNNFGAAGGNTSIIVQEATPRPRKGEDTRQTQVLTISAKTAFSLHENIKRLVDYMEAREDISIADLAYTLSGRRNHYNYRVSVLASSRVEAIDVLRPHLVTSLDQAPHFGKQAPVVFAFTGQGTFYIGIGAQLYRDSPLFRQQLDQLDSLARRQNFVSFLSIIMGTCRPEDVSTVSMHLAIVCVEIALARLWTSLGVKPSVVLGHSLGEYAALAVAGVLSDSTAVFLVGTRAMLLTSTCTSNTHGMLSVRTSVANVAQAAGDVPFEVACINGPNETVVGGKLADIAALSDALALAGHRSVKLDVAHAYHTSQMDALLDEFVTQTQAVVCKKPSIPIISPRHAGVLNQNDVVDVSYLAAATRETVDFAGALKAAWESGIVSNPTIWLEVGHHPTCTGFITRTLPSTRLVVSSLHRDSDNWTNLAKTLSALYSAGMDVDWNEYHRPFELAGALRLVDAPTYAWNNKNYWIQYRGDWNLTKGRSAPEPEPTLGANRFQTSSIHRLISEEYSRSKAKLSAETSITDPSLEGVVDGHAMNGYGVASSFLHADMAFTLASRIISQMLPGSASLGINIADFEYHEPVVKLQRTSDAQPILVAAEADLDKMEVQVKWFNPAKELWYCHATVLYEEPSSWLSTWARNVKLVSSRIDALNDMAAAGRASKLTTDLAYSLFGKLVGYSKLYQTMQSVILNEDEAVAEVVFPADASGAWTVPPHFIDGLVSLSGFILNGGTHFDNTNNFFITPSWKSMRFARPLAAGGRYLAYVRMVPVDGHSYAGDVSTASSELLMQAVLWRKQQQQRSQRPLRNPNFSHQNVPPRLISRRPAREAPHSL
ncbi:polyketide synthase [Pseudomassariella vexata]|uniref:Polyketide synthase n=1 Tax=Pseudomassariella vexata TaxID=1141098 RepID=A0A1Y2DBG6_9PEZI|nr:polyketide synthase [Pseudomassariella vexata]ORY56609.1 polyketide synthase [Pseudomassariella vexata]